MSIWFEGHLLEENCMSDEMAPVTAARTFIVGKLQHFWYFFLGLMLAGAFALYHPNVGCYDAKKVMKHYLAYRHEGALSTAVDVRGNVFMWFLNHKTGEWSLIRVDGDQACFMTEGTDYRFIIESFI
jgi:hypothetical protein